MHQRKNKNKYYLFQTKSVALTLNELGDTITFLVGLALHAPVLSLQLQVNVIPSFWLADRPHLLHLVAQSPDKILPTLTDSLFFSVSLILHEGGVGVGDAKFSCLANLRIVGKMVAIRIIATSIQISLHNLFILYYLYIIKILF
jgi:hypothetical protein